MHELKLKAAQLKCPIMSFWGIALLSPPPKKKGQHSTNNMLMPNDK